MSSAMVQVLVVGSAHPKVHSCILFLATMAGKAPRRGMELQPLEHHVSIINSIHACELPLLHIH